MVGKTLSFAALMLGSMLFQQPNKLSAKVTNPFGDDYSILKQKSSYLV